MAERLQVESKVFEAHVGEWRSAHMGEFVLIKGEEVIGFYESLDEAFDQGGQRYGMADFFIEQILPAETVNISFVGQVA
jgi:predicted acetyltransferase